MNIVNLRRARTFIRLLYISVDYIVLSNLYYTMLDTLVYKQTLGKALDENVYKY